MNDLNTLGHYQEIIFSEHKEALETICAGTSQEIAYMLAGAVRFAEESLNISISEEDLPLLFSEIVKALILRIHGIESKSPNSLIEIIVGRYREKVNIDLGGLQTPRTSYASSEVQKSASLMLRSGLIVKSKARRFSRFKYLDQLINKVISLKSKRASNEKS